MIRLCRKKKWVLVLVFALGLVFTPLSHSMGMSMSMEMDSCMTPVHCSACAASISLGFDPDEALILSLDVVPSLLTLSVAGIPQSLFHPPRVLFL